MTALKGKHILLVEDNQINQLLVQYTLSPSGVDLDICETGVEAIQKLHEQRYDVILMDIHMPELDGYETTQIIRKKLQLEVPILALTASLESEAEKCLDAGMNGTVQKPFTVESLEAALEKFVA